MVQQQSVGLVFTNCRCRHLGPLHMSPLNWAGPLTAYLGKFQPGFRDEKRLYKFHYYYYYYYYCYYYYYYSCCCCCCCCYYYYYYYYYYYHHHHGDEFWLQMREPKQTWRTDTGSKFGFYITSANLKPVHVSLQLNEVLMMYLIYQAMQVDAMRAARIHPAFILVTGLKCSYGKISSPLTEIPVGKTEISGTEPSR